MNKTFRSRITAIVGQGISSQGNTLASLILADAQINNYLYSTTPDFGKVTEEGEFGLYSTQDDYGTSYYFRGDVENNYVELGRWKEGTVRYFSDGPNVEYYNTLEECESGNNHSTYGTACVKEGVESGSPMYWRIVRINGDGTIRLVYDGTIAVDNDENHNSSVGSTVYNNTSLDIKYVGYTYDDGNGNQVDSTIKGVVDEWYTNNLEQDYGKYIADSIFCNDRDITKTSDNYIYYGAYDRLYTNKSPILTCTNQSDRYTVDDITKGNGLLTKPIGLMTADEIVMAGNCASNSNYYLYTGFTYDWSMSPSYFGGGAHMLEMYDSSYRNASIVNGRVDDVHSGVRPVINIKANALFTGSGTIDDPYKLSE